VSNATIVTVRGRVFDYHKPHSYEYDIYDISHSLSKICRFAGNTSSFYSVAQHSVIVAKLAAKIHPALAKMALLHDASEAFMNDMPSPLKKLFPEFSAIEDNILVAVYNYFDVNMPTDYPEVISPVVKKIDREVGIAEMRDLFDGRNSLVTAIIGEAEYIPQIVPLNHEDANGMFLRAFFDICKGKFN